MSTRKNRDKEVLISTVLTGIVAAITLLIYIIDLNKYAIIISLLISIEAFLYSVYAYFNDIREKFNGIMKKLETWMSGNLQIGQHRGEMYEGAADRARRATKRFLVVQRTPTLFFPIRNREGRNGEITFKEALNQVIEKAKVNHNFEYIMLFSFFNEAFKNEFLSYDNDTQKKIIKDIIDYCSLNNYKNIYIASLPPDSYSVHPLLISDDEISFWLTGATGERIFIDLSNLPDVADRLFDYYKHIGERYKYKCESYLERFMKSIKR